MSSEFLDVRDYDSDGDDDVRLIQEQGAPDTSPIMFELTTNDFPFYFSEHEGRLFHSHHSSPYPLPADTPEQQRLNVLHIALNRLIGANYVGPVSDVLAPEPGHQKMVLDLCTGTGKWVMDMARDFPHVLFRGIDIVPIATRYPLANVRFEVHDVNEQYRWQDASIDFVHARGVSMAVRDYPTVLQEVGRVLRPGGLFLSCEWEQSQPVFHPTFQVDLPSSVPGACHFYDTLTRALDICRSIQPIASHVPMFIDSSDLFTDITASCYYMPIGPWHDDPSMKMLGRAYRASLLRYIDSVKPLLREAGYSEAEIDEITGAYIHELKTVRGMVSSFHTVHARRL